MALRLGQASQMRNTVNTSIPSDSLSCHASLFFQVSFCPITVSQVCQVLYLKQPCMWRITFTPRHCHKRQGTLVVVPVCRTPFVSNTKICLWRIGWVISSAPKWTYLVPLNLTSINFITIFSILPTLPWFGHVTHEVCVCVNLCAIW